MTSLFVDIIKMFIL